jgi:hypothetical protein
MTMDQKTSVAEIFRSVSSMLTGCTPAADPAPEFPWHSAKQAGRAAAGAPQSLRKNGPGAYQRAKLESELVNNAGLGTFCRMTAAVQGY